MITRVLLIISLLLIGTSCTNEDEEKGADNGITKRLKVIDRARDVRQKQNEAIESQNKLIEDITKGHRKESGDGTDQTSK